MAIDSNACTLCKNQLLLFFFDVLLNKPRAYNFWLTLIKPVLPKCTNNANAHVNNFKLLFDTSRPIIQ